MKQQALVVIDIQNDYFANGKYPLAQTEQVLTRILEVVSAAQKRYVPIILVQHLSDAEHAPFFNQGSEGAKIHSALLASSPTSPVVIKKHADSFDQTQLEQTLSQWGIEQIILCGMMTQNCVTYTALSPIGAKYHPIILADCCTSVDEMVHQIALKALARRAQVISSRDPQLFI